MSQKAILFFCCFLFAAFSAHAEPVSYVVSADIVATAETPGFEYAREEHGIEYVEGLKEALLYGNVIKAVPLEQGEFSGQWAEAFDDGGKSIGYVAMSAIAPLPELQAFSQGERCRFTVDSPDLFLLPGSLPLVDYTLPEDAAYHVLAGEVTDGVGTSMGPDGKEWTLLRFETSNYGGVGSRYAWIRSDEAMRLSGYEPDYAKVDPALLPRNIRDFGSVGDNFREALLRNGFAIDATPLIRNKLVLDDLVESYPDASFEEIFVPNFVTTDLFLHAFHLVFSRGLKNIEEINLAPGLEKMLMEALSALNELEKKSGKNAFMRSTFSRARDFLTVPAFLISPESTTVKPSKQAREEIDRILKAKGTAYSSISGREEDYTFYRPRGHYTSSETLSRYFRAMACLGGLPVLLNPDDAKKQKENAALIALLCMLFEDKKLHEQWNALYEPLTYLVGSADDPSIHDCGPAVRKLLNGKPGKLTDDGTLTVLHKEFLEIASRSRIIDNPSSRPSMSQEERENESAGFRLMGRRFVLDAWIFAQLTSPQVGSDLAPRNLPRTADVMAALGSSAAEALLEGEKRDIPGYADALEKTTSAVHDFFSKGSENVYTDWLGMLALLFADRDSRQFFWNAPLWDAKKLLTASASWTELKHDTVLYAKQSYAEMGGGGEWEVEPFKKPAPRGYVEPAPQVFNAMFNALDRLRELVAQYALGDKDEESSWHGVRAKVEAFREHVLLFRDIAEKEVKDQPLTADDYHAIAQITSYLNSNLLLDSNIVEDESDDSLKMALVTDVATDALAGRVLQVATGTPRRIYVFVDDKQSGPRVTVGYVYSYYEFERSLTEGRMTDEEWKKIVYDDGGQDLLETLMPEWCKELFVH